MDGEQSVFQKISNVHNRQRGEGSGATGLSGSLNRAKSGTAAVQGFNGSSGSMARGSSRTSSPPGGRQNVGRPPAGGSAGTSVGADALLTQAQQLQVKETGMYPINSREQMERLRLIQQRAKNLSPMIPSHYAPLLPSSRPGMERRKVLVLDVDETLVHSKYKEPTHYDAHLQCEVNGSICNIFVGYRPGLREFLSFVKDLFEVVIFTASVEIYCNPLMDKIDPRHEMGNLRLFRSHCSYVNGSYVKDLSLIGRPLDQIAIIDNSPVAYLFQPRNAIPIKSWFEDPNDTELLKLMDMLRQLAAAPDVYEVLDIYNSQQIPPER